MTDQHKTPCGECPFSRKVEPGALGGSPPEMYVGQSNGPFWLPCHSHSDFADPNWKTDYTKPQCAGSAIFRANVGRGKALPAALLRLPQDRTIVFATFAELYAHHKKISVEEAEILLRVKTPDQHLYDELLKVRELQKNVPQSVRLVPRPE